MENKTPEEFYHQQPRTRKGDFKYEQKNGWIDYKFTLSDILAFNN